MNFLTLFKREPSSKQALMKPKMAEVSVGERKVWIRALSASYLLGYQDKAMETEDFFDMIAHSVCDKNGNPIMTKEDAGELDFLTLNLLSIEILEFNKLSKEAAEKAKAELKNSQAGG